MRKLLFTLLLLVSLAARADQYIAVNASGWVEAIPDMLSMTATVRSTGTDVEALQRQVDDIARKVAEAARELEVEDGDIDSSQISIRPDYQWQDGQRIYRGQTVERSITITLRKLDNYGELVAALSRYAVDDLGQPRLSHSNIDELNLKALENALKRGAEKAQRIASAIDARLGEVLRVEEQGASQPAPTAMMLAAEARSAAAPEIQFGKQRISASVTMRFAIN